MIIELAADPVEAIHMDLCDLAEYVTAVVSEAPDDADGAMVADFIIDNDEPDDHDRVLSDAAYRPVIAAMATLAIAQRDMARGELAEETAQDELGYPPCDECGRDAVPMDQRADGRLVCHDCGGAFVDLL